MIVRLYGKCLPSLRVIRKDLLSFPESVRSDHKNNSELKGPLPSTPPQPCAFGNKKRPTNLRRTV